MRTSCKRSGLAQLTIQKHVFIGSRSVRLLTYVGLAVMMAVAIAVSYSVSLSYGRGELLNNTSFLYEIPEFGFSFAQIFFGASFIVFVCTEWSSGFIYTTYGATQRPYGFVLAKLVWPLVFAVCVFSALLILLIPIEDVLVSNGTPYGVSFSDPVVWRQIVVANFNLMCSGLFAAGLAFVFRQAASALGTYIAVSLIAPIVFGLIPLQVSEEISKWLPNNLFGYLITRDPEMIPNLNYPLLLVAAAAYPVIALTVGAYVMRRKII